MWNSKSPKAMEFQKLALGGLFEIPKEHKKNRITENSKAHFTVFKWLEFEILT